MKDRFYLHTGFFTMLLIAIPCSSVAAQESVFSLLENPLKKADAFYADKNYDQALEFYLKHEASHPTPAVEMKIARSYYYVNQPMRAVNWYERAMKNEKLTAADIYLYAESLTASHEYEKAIVWYSRYQADHPDDDMTQKKIWQLKNRSYLYEDSVHYILKPLSINSKAGEMCGAAFDNGVVYLSNRKSKTDIGGNEPYFKTYYAKAIVDTLKPQEDIQFAKPQLFGRGLKTQFHNGPLCFYQNDTRLVYATTGEPSKTDKEKRNLELYFAEWQQIDWVTTGMFRYNNTEYSITDPAMTNDGKTLYFSSDMPNGYGGYDIYVSHWDENNWTTPVNVGDKINTKGNERFPFVAKHTLYFTSSGHAGLGGMDVFKSSITGEDFGDVTNLGYPINTNFDDFALTLDSTVSFGYLSSNREKGNDDLYYVNIDLQTYPLIINGILKYKENGWKDDTDLKILGNATLLLVDNKQNDIVFKTSSDATGHFSLTIPYFSQYRIKVLNANGTDEASVSLDLSKSKNSGSEYEIVVVKNVFKN